MACSGLLLGVYYPCRVVMVVRNSHCYRENATQSALINECLGKANSVNNVAETFVCISLVVLLTGSLWIIRNRFQKLSLFET